MVCTFMVQQKNRRQAKGLSWQKFHPSKILSERVNTKARLVNTSEDNKNGAKNNLFTNREFSHQLNADIHLQIVLFGLKRTLKTINRKRLGDTQLKTCFHKAIENVMFKEIPAVLRDRCCFYG